MYKIYTPHGIVETDSHSELLEYQRQGCTFEEIDEEFSPLHVFEETEGLNRPYVITGEAFVIDAEKEVNHAY